MAKSYENIPSEISPLHRIRYRPSLDVSAPARILSLHIGLILLAQILSENFSEFTNFNIENIDISIYRILAKFRSSEFRVAPSIFATPTLALGFPSNSRNGISKTLNTLLFGYCICQPVHHSPV